MSEYRAKTELYNAFISFSLSKSSWYWPKSSFTDAGGKEYLQREKLKQEVEFQKTTNVQTATEKEESALQSAILYIPFRTIKNLLNRPRGKLAGWR